MKKLFMTLLLASPAVFANPQQELNERLNQLKGFTANFAQVVTSPEGKVLNEAKGDLAILRPNLFKWQTLEPDENLLISDGITLWYYSPFVEQVTAMWTKDAAEQTPFVLLTRNNAKDWDNYEISQQGDNFTIKPKKKSNLGIFSVDVAKDGKINGFSVLEKDGQTSKFVFNELKVTQPEATLFKFKVPEGVELDDQRQK